jgi:hypothetical protein
MRIHCLLASIVLFSLHAEAQVLSPPQGRALPSGAQIQTDARDPNFDHSRPHQCGEVTLNPGVSPERLPPLTEEALIDLAEERARENCLYRTGNLPPFRRGGFPPYVTYEFKGQVTIRVCVYC